jgi:RibD C-terminal domain
MKGGTTFHFVTDGIEAAVERATDAAGGKDVNVAGGADAINQALAAGLVDDLEVHVVPILLGSGARPFDLLSPNGGERPQPVERRQSSWSASISARTARISDKRRSISASRPVSPSRWRKTIWPRSAARPFWRRFREASCVLLRAVPAPRFTASPAFFA